VAVAIDPHAGYLRGISAVLSDVTVTVDHFHAIKFAGARSAPRSGTGTTKKTRCIEPVA
jgi:hypothetical protein